MAIRKYKQIVSSLLIINALFTTIHLPADEVEKLSAPQENKSENTPFTVFQFSFFAPLQIFSDNTDVYGFRLTLPHGENKDLKGLDLGVSNQLDNLYGVSIAVLLSQRTEDMYGLNLVGFINLSEGADIGLSMAGFYNQIHTIEGVQVASLYNQAQLVKGVQFGLVNFCKDMKGAQIGVFNVCKSQPFPFTLFFNFWR